MKQSLKKEKLLGADGFDSYYGSLFEKRWPLLKEALFAEACYLELSLGGEKPYFLDPASVCAALCLDTSRPGDDDDDFCIADLCAAPGGKSLVIASCTVTFFSSSERFCAYTTPGRHSAAKTRKARIKRFRNNFVILFSFRYHFFLYK